MLVSSLICKLALDVKLAHSKQKLKFICRPEVAEYLAWRPFHAFKSVKASKREPEHRQVWTKIVCFNPL